MEKRDYLIILYDYYGELLKDEEKHFFEAYYFDNLSLGEIADASGISRNAIHKHLKSSKEKLLFYEGKLKLYEKESKLKALVSKITDKKLKEKIEKLVK